MSCAVTHWQLGSELQLNAGANLQIRIKTSTTVHCEQSEERQNFLSCIICSNQLVRCLCTAFTASWIRLQYKHPSKFEVVPAVDLRGFDEMMDVRPHFVMNFLAVSVAASSVPSKTSRSAPTKDVMIMPWALQMAKHAV